LGLLGIVVFVANLRLNDADFNDDKKDAGERWATARA
jgi:hypothetical protein